MFFRKNLILATGLLFGLGLTILFSGSAFSQTENLNYAFSEPIKISIDLLADKTFILNYGTNELTVFDRENHKIITSIPTGGQGSIDMIGISGENVYILNQDSNNITVFSSLIFEKDLNSDLVSKIIEERKFISLSPEGLLLTLTYNPISQKIYILQTNNVISVIDRKTDEVSLITLESIPSRFTINFEENKIYLISSSGNSLSIIDGKTGKLIKTLQLGFRLADLRIVPGNRLFISSWGDDKIYVIDCSTDEMIASFKSGGKGPGPMNFDAVRGKLYVSNQLDNSISVIDLEKFKLIKKISLPLNSNPGLPVIPPNSKLVFVVNQGTNTFSVIDGSQDEITAVFETGANPGLPVASYGVSEVYIPNRLSDSITIVSMSPEGEFQAQTIPEQKEIISTGKDFSYPIKLVFNEKESQVYILNNLGENFLILDGKNYKIKDKISVGLYPREILFASELNKIFVSNTGDDNITVYNLKDKSQKTIEVGKRPIDLIFNPQTKKLYILNYDSQDVSVVDAEKENLLTNISLEGMPGAITLNSKDNKIYVAGLANNELIIIDGNTDKILERKEVGLRPNSLFYDKIFNRLYVASPVSNELFVIDGDESNRFLKTIKVDNPGYMSLDEVGKKIYLSANRIRVINGDSLEVEEYGGPCGVETAGIAGKTIVDQKNKKLFVLTAKGFLDVISLESKEILASLNMDELVNSLVELGRVNLTDMVLSPETGKLFISLGRANAIAVVNAQTNILETVISDKGIAGMSPTWQGKILKFLKSNIFYILGGIILLIIIIYFAKYRLVRKHE